MLTAAALSFAPANAAAAPVVPSVQGQTIADFYRARGGAPLWLSPAAGNSAEQLISLLSTASIDGLDPDRYHVAKLRDALKAAWGGKRKAVEAADEMLSEAFVDYVSDLDRDPGVGILYVDPQLRPKPPSALATLLYASAAPSLSNYLATMGWMNPM